MCNIKCLIVDDEAIAQRIIAGYLRDLSGYEIIATCKTAIEAMNILNSNEVDLMFLDVEMPKLTGLDFLKALTKPPAVIITTAHREYALEGHNLEVLDYLLKPISFDRFIKSVNRYKKKNNPQSAILKETTNTKTLYVKSDRRTVKINTAEITHIEGMNNYIIIHTLEHQHIVYKSMSEILLELEGDFARIHKSYIINTSRIKSFSREAVEVSQVTLPIGKTYKGVLDLF